MAQDPSASPALTASSYASGVSTTQTVKEAAEKSSPLLTELILKGRQPSISVPFGNQADLRPTQPRGSDGWTLSKDRVDGEASADEDLVTGEQGFQWKSAIKQSLLFLGVQHGYAMTQPKTRSALRGPFFRDYFRSVKTLHGWGDGGRFFTNYVAHPMQGSFVGFIQIQNDPEGRTLHVANTKAYWKSRLKAAAWSAAWSTQFEIGPISQASIGNVGLYEKQTWVDIVVTPTLGTGLLVAEDAADRYVIRRIERRFPKNFWLKIVTRMLLNPTRTMGNLLAFKEPWHRDTAR
ncbi:MAG: hypothetical protein H0X08_00365 [Blastocatellia bacterium]|nr:hypothetical protein [Blastocatellia bacterium]